MTGAIKLDIGEQVNILIAFVKDEPLCKKEEEPENRGWKCRIGKKGDPGDLGLPTAKRLHDNMKKPESGISLPAKPKKTSGSWDLDSCQLMRFPFQSHHLIPKMHLPDHDVCVWLARNAANSHWELTESTNYDTDDARNGTPLPFASTTHQWKAAKSPLDIAEQGRVCNEMMRLTQKQLHQGQHTYDDYMEQDELHADEQPGYLGAVDELLKVVNGETLKHVIGCDECKKSQSKPVKVRPLERIVLSMYQVSALMGSIIISHKRFVSNRAADYFGKGSSQ